MANQSNNKKKKKAAVKREPTKHEEAAEPVVSNPPGVLSNPQLTALIMFSMGVAKLLQLRSAASTASSSVCIEHLGEEACQDETILLLLQYKFSSALIGCCIATLIGLQVWRSDDYLMQVNSLLVVSPWLTSAAVFYLSPQVIPNKVAFQQLLKCLTLGALAFSTALPFRGPRIGTNKQLPSLVCGALTLLCALQAIQYGRLSLGSDVGSTWLAVQPDQLAVSEFSAPILQLLAADYCAMALLMAFCWRSLPDVKQRVSLLQRCYIVPSRNLSF